MRISFIIIVLSLLESISIKKNVEIPDKDWQQALIAFKELNEALNKEKGQTWNYSLAGALMLVNRDTRTIIANEQDNVNGLVKRASFFIGKLPENITISNTAFDWNGKRWTMVALPLPETKEARLNLLIHESFHRIQPAIGFDQLSEMQSVHLDKKNGRVYLKLELEALKKALKSDNPDNHIKNALLFRQYRHKVFSEAKDAENTLEIIEGLAEYTGSILSQRNEADLKKHYYSQIDWFYTMPTFVRSFAYFTIPVYGFFMHQTDKKWNLQVKKDTNLTDFIAQRYSVGHLELSYEHISALGKEYGMDSILENENNRELRREALINSYKRKFLNDSVVVFGLENMSIGFNPSNIMPLDSLGTVYPNIRVTDNWGILEVDSCGALMSPRWDKVTISYPEVITDSLVLGRGWKLKINNSWKLRKIENGYRMTKKIVQKQVTFINSI